MVYMIKIFLFIFCIINSVIAKTVDSSVTSKPLFLQQDKKIDNLIKEYKDEQKIKSKNKNTIYCPFNTKEDCEIWIKKPNFKQTFSKIVTPIPEEAIKSMILKLNRQQTIKLGEKNNICFLNKYKEIKKIVSDCCFDQIKQVLKNRESTTSEIYDFLNEDSLSYNFQERCLFYTDRDIDKMMANESADVIIDVKNICACFLKNKLHVYLNDFYKVINSTKNFSKAPMYFSYKDVFENKRTYSLSRDILNLIENLNSCKK